MSSYEFKEWLNYSEAAAYLSDRTGRKYDADAIDRAANHDLLRVHYWPTDNAQLGVFQVVFDEKRIKKLPSFFERSVESAMPVHLDRFDLLLPFEGPVPIMHYQVFAMNCRAPHRSPIGITVQVNPLDEGLFVAGGCYRVGDQGEAISLKDGTYDYFIHVTELEELAKAIPDVPRQPPLICNFNLIKSRDENDSEDYAFIHSSTPYMRYPEVAREGAGKSIPSVMKAPKRPEPMLRTIGLAAHLIAELGDQLDAYETIATRKKGLSCGEKPNCSTIARELARIAAEHNFDLKSDGFSKTLSAALKYLQP